MKLIHYICKKNRVYEKKGTHCREWSRIKNGVEDVRDGYLLLTLLLIELSGTVYKKDVLNVERTTGAR